MSELSELLKDLDIKGAMREAFGKCPKDGTPLVAGQWLKWCPDRKCSWHAPK